MRNNKFRIRAIALNIFPVDGICVCWVFVRGKTEKQFSYEGLSVAESVKLWNILGVLETNYQLKNRYMHVDYQVEKTGKSVCTIKRETTMLKEKGYIRRLNGKRNGKWEVLMDVTRQ